MRVEKDLGIYSLNQGSKAKDTSGLIIGVDTFVGGMCTENGIFLPPSELFPGITAYAHESAHWIAKQDSRFTTDLLLEFAKKSLRKKITVPLSELLNYDRVLPWDHQGRLSLASSVLKAIVPNAPKVPIFALTQDDLDAKVKATSTTSTTPHKGKVNIFYSKAGRNSEVVAFAFEYAAMQILENSINSLPGCSLETILSTSSRSPSHQRAQNIAARLLGL